VGALDRPLRLGIVAPFYPPFEGGTERVAARVGEMLCDRGLVVSVHTLKHKPDLSNGGEYRGIRVTRHAFSYRRVFGFTDIHAPSLVSTMREWDVDCVHVHSVTFPRLLTEVARALRERNIPTALITHGLFEAMQGEHRGVKQLVYRALAQRTIRTLVSAVDVVAALSSADLELLRGNSARLPYTRILHNGVDLPCLTPDETMPPDDPLKILHVANLKPNKGHLDMLQAIAMVDFPLEYHIVGATAPLWEVHSRLVDQTIEAHGLQDRVLRHGHVDDTTRDRLYRQADVVVVPSHSETFPLAVLEAMSHGKPVIATGVGGIPDMLGDGVDGRLVDPRAPWQIAAALAELRDPVVRHRYGGKARAKAESRFSWERIVDGYEALTYELCESKSIVRSGAIEDRSLSG
jgi:glycosyltransferase involved in cell wall biosynthesis